MNTQPKCPKYRSLDIWRGIACLMVVVFHSTLYGIARNQQAPHDAVWWIAAFTRRLWMGVPIFFVISGYCISATADATRLRAAPTRTYFLRRFRRIFPPYWAMLAALAVFMGVVAKTTHLPLGGAGFDQIWAPWDLNLSHWLQNVSLTAVWSYKVAATDQRLFLAQSWSLCYEEIFYAVMGVVLATSRRHLFACLSVFSGLAAAACTAAWLRNLPSLMPPFVYWLLFAAGVLVYFQINYPSRVRSAAAAAALFLAIGIAVRHPASLLEPSANLPQFAVSAFVFALLLMALRSVDVRLASSPWLMPVQYCGKLCYSMYLVHWPVVYLVSIGMYRLGLHSLAATLALTVPVCVAVSVALAQIFHTLVERRFLNASLPMPALAQRGPSLQDSVIVQAA
jgi:peptidoglycan/LPS O-acetylase OafA/YrhL